MASAVEGHSGCCDGSKKRPREVSVGDPPADDPIGVVINEQSPGELSSKLRKLGAADPWYKALGRLFLEGLGLLSAAAVVTRIHKLDFSDAGGQARVDSFKKRRQITQDCRGDATIQSCWYGCGKDELLSIVKHGFGVPKQDDYGIGVYLSPKQYSCLSAVGADVDDKGEQHMLFCQVILGRSELVERGSTQFCPSKEVYDTGLDDLSNPKRYVVWSTHMNTNILPVYVISFKLPPEWHEATSLQRASFLNSDPPTSKMQDGSVAQNANSKLVSMLCKQDDPPTQNSNPKLFSDPKCSMMREIPVAHSSNPKLFPLLKPQLAPADMRLLEQHYADYKNGKLPFKKLLSIVKAVAGDSTLRKIQEQVLNSSSNLLYYRFCLHKRMRCS